MTVTVSTDGTPSHQIRGTKDGYQDWEQTYNGNPFQGETIHINADLVYIPITLPTTPPVGPGKAIIPSARPRQVQVSILTDHTRDYPR